MRIEILIAISLIILSGCLVGTQEESNISRVIDGDTVETNSGEKVRLIGVDTPEKFGKVNTDEFRGVTNESCLKKYSYEATSFMEMNIEGEEVILERDILTGNRGSYGRLLRYINHSETDYNRKLVEKGLARVYTESSFTRKSKYINAEEKARGENIGLWSCN